MQAVPDQVSDVVAPCDRLMFENDGANGITQTNKMMGSLRLVQATLRRRSFELNLRGSDLQLGFRFSSEPGEIFCF